MKIDITTLKVNEATGRLYAAGAVPDIDINVDDIIDAVRKQVPMTTLPDNGHTLLGTEVFDDAINHINERFDTDEKSLTELDTAVKLDNLEKGIDDVQTSVGGMKFVTETRNGWTVHTSETGLTVATLELDIDSTTIWSWSTTSSPYGAYRLSIDIQENLPVDTFTLPPNINVTCYTTNENYSFITTCIAPPSNTYIGKWQVIMLDKAGAGGNKPNSFHLVFQATGF